MSEGITVRCQLHVKRGRKSRKEVRAGARPAVPIEQIPRVSKLMALAIRWDELIREGVVHDYAEIARLAHLTRARVTQIINLLSLAPDIQERILNLTPAASGEMIASERRLRPVTAEPIWVRQRILLQRVQTSGRGKVCVRNGGSD